MRDVSPIERRPQQLFLSYASADKDVAQKIADKLRHSGLRIWFSEYELQAGDSITERIQDAIAASDHLIVLLSPSSVRSNWVQRELNAALSRELTSRAVTILPILIADCDIPSHLANRVYLDLRENFDQGLAQLVEQLGIAPDIDFSTLDTRSFENLVVELLEQMGFSQVVREWQTAAGRVDIKASYTSTDPFGTAKEEIWLAEIKFYRHARADLNS